MADTSDIKKGAVIRHNNNLFVVTACQFVNPGKGQAFVKTKLKSIDGAKGTELTFKSGESVDIVEVFHENLQFLFQSGEFYSFMNKDNYETVEVSKDVVGDDAPYLKEGLEVVASLNDGSVVALQLPKKVTYTVKSAPPAVKGDSSTGNVTKEIELDNGLKIQAPIFITDGEEIVVNTETGLYGGRALE